jgi:hypothetical protein
MEFMLEDVGLIRGGSVHLKHFSLLANFIFPSEYSNKNLGVR